MHCKIVLSTYSASARLRTTSEASVEIEKASVTRCRSDKSKNSPSSSWTHPSSVAGLLRGDYPIS
jgi:hypothetical protein